MAELTIHRKPLVKQSSGDLTTRGGEAQAYHLDGRYQSPTDPAEMKVCTILFRQQSSGGSAAIPDDRRPAKEASFCQIMAHGDGTAMLVGFGFSTAISSTSIWHDEARRLGTIIASESVFVPRPVATKAADTKLRLYVLAATTLTTAYASYVPARTPEMALKLWTLSKYGLPAGVPRERIMVLPVRASSVSFLLALPSVVNWEQTRELSTGRGSVALR